MRSRPDFIHQRVAENLAEGGGNVTDVVMTWREWPAGSTLDPVTQARTGTPIERNQVLRALVHFVQPANVNQVRQHAEIEVGDCIVDFAPDAPIDGKDEPRFIIAGQQWVPKKVNGKLPSSWDALVGGQKMFRTVLLELAR